MGFQLSKPVKSAAEAVAKRQYPKQPSAAASRAPSTQAAEATQEEETGKQRKEAEAAPGEHGHGPTYHSQEKASGTKSEAIDLDARDPHFAASLRSIGPVVPNPTLSHSSTARDTTTTATTTTTTSPSASSQASAQSQQPQSKSQPQPNQQPPNLADNPALLTLSARSTLTHAAEREAESLGRTSHAGREFLDAVSIKRVLAMRDRQGLSDEVIERHMRLKRGTVARLGGGKDRVVGEVRAA